MIVTEKLLINGRKYNYTYSDAGKYIVRNGLAFESAYDPEEFKRKYTEGPVIIPVLSDFEAMEYVVCISGITQDKANLIRAMIEKASISLTDSEALDAVELFPAWKIDTDYAIDVRVRYNGQLYKCVQVHTSSAEWPPDLTPALWTPVAEPGTIPVWIQPTGAQDAYRIGDKVHYPSENDPVYVCTIDFNVYAPDVAGWVQE